LALEQQGGDKFFGEPMLEISDMIRTTSDGKGMINILAADTLYSMPKLYAMSLLWLLSELYENMPEVGDLDKPKMVFFFDEAHLLFNDTPAVLMEKIEQVVRLIRSKGIGVFFVTQNPSDVPDSVLGQLGNRVQHALRAFTPKDLKSVKAAAQSMRANPEIDTEKAIQELGTGEALISFLDEKGSPSIVQQCSVIAPGSRLGAATEGEISKLIKNSSIHGRYEKRVDRESAYEIVTKQLKEIAKEEEKAAKAAKKAKSSGSSGGGLFGGVKDFIFGSTGARGAKKKDGLVHSVTRTAKSKIAQEVVRGVLGNILKK
jgi:DNA helicase HerA-like ATPase